MASGAGKRSKDAIFLVIGTGVGGALVVDKKLHHGAHLLGENLAIYSWAKR